MQQPTKKKKKKPRGSGMKTGMAPGTMVFIGEQKQERSRIDAIQYTDSALTEQQNVTVAHCRALTQKPGVTWINVNGIHDIALIQSLGESFGLHPLTLEDIVNTAQRLKIEEFPDYLFVVLKMVQFNDSTSSIETEHISLVMGEQYVITFQESESDIFDAVRKRIITAKTRIRTRKSDYLAYALMDTVVDNYFLAVERIGDRIEELDERILSEPQPDDLHTIHRLKRDILSLRKAIRPLREEIGSLEKSDSPLIHHETRIFWRDLYDHTLQIIDMIESFRDMLSGMHDTYLTNVNNRMNEVMKVLTIIATIFIPLTFIAGVYGMNFAHMPELRWRYGYYLVWGVMIAVGVGLLAYFKRRKWF